MEKKLYNMTKKQLERLLIQIETEIRELDNSLDESLSEGGGEKLIWESYNPPNNRLVEFNKYRNEIEKELDKRKSYD